MARIVGVDLPKNKRGEIGLTYIYGIGRSTARAILEKAQISYDVKVKDWSDENVAAIRNRDRQRGLQGGRRAPLDRSAQHQAPDGHRLLPGHPPPLGAACPRAEYEEQRRTRKGRKKTVANKKKATK